MPYDSLIVSDIHLGSKIARAKDLLTLLKNTQFKRLILLGDIFADLNFSRLTKEQWKLISYIRTLSNPKRGVEVVWVEGNHDAGITEVMEHLLGVKVYQQYEWAWAGHKCFAIHGHQYDSLWAGGTPMIGAVFTKFYLWLQHFKTVQNWLPRLLDRLHTHWERLDTKVMEGAFAKARREEAQFIFCGHTHHACHEIRDGVGYWNTGHWTGDVSTYVTLGEEGVELHELRTHHSDPS